jgi:acyl-ACP thioesterase
LKLPEEVEFVFPDRLNKLETLDSADFTKSIQVSYGDLDMHKHVNNLRYVEWMVNCLPLEFLSTHILKEIEINYMSEASYTNEIAMSYEKKGKSNFFHTIRRKSDNTETCRARTVWEQSEGS